MDETQFLNSSNLNNKKAMMKKIYKLLRYEELPEYTELTGLLNMLLSPYSSSTTRLLMSGRFSIRLILLISIDIIIHGYGSTTNRRDSLAIIRLFGWCNVLFPSNLLSLPMQPRLAICIPRVITVLGVFAVIVLFSPT